MEQTFLNELTRIYDKDGMLASRAINHALLVLNMLADYMDEDDPDGDGGKDCRRAIDLITLYTDINAGL